MTGDFVARVYPFENVYGDAPGGFNSGYPSAYPGGNLPLSDGDGHATQFLDGNNYIRSEVAQIISDDPTAIFQHAITNIADNGSGKCRLTISPAISAAKSAAGFVTGSYAAVGQVTGTVEANTAHDVPTPWQITVVNSTTVDLPVNFTNAYTGGGYIFAGPLDMAPYYGVTRCVNGRPPVAGDYLGGFQFAGQTTQHSAPYNYAAFISSIINPDETHDGAHGALFAGVSGYNPVTGNRQYVSSVAFMRGLIGLAPGYELPGEQPGSPANFQSADKGWQTVNMGIGYFVNGAPIGRPVGGSHKNLVITNDSTNPNSKIYITADAIALDGPTATCTGNTTTMPTTTTMTGFPQAIDFTINGINGLDEGSLAANTWYSLWCVYNPATGSQGVIGSTSATVPLLSPGFTFKARVGWARTDANGHFIRFRQSGNKAQYLLQAGGSLPVIDSGIQGNPIGTVTWHSASVSTVVPSTASRIGFVTQAGGGTSSSVIIVAPNNNYAGFGMPNAAPIGIFIGTTGGFTMGEFELESSNICYASNISSGTLRCLGWEDNI